MLKKLTSNQSSRENQELAERTATLVCACRAVCGFDPEARFDLDTYITYE